MNYPGDAKKNNDRHLPCIIRAMAGMKRFFLREVVRADKRKRG
jgi:hypothetical protein